MFMKNKILPISFLSGLLLFPATLFADIVYQGKLVQEWPAEAMPTFDNSRGAQPRALMKTTAVTTKSHYAAPKGKFYSLTLLVDFSDQPAPVTKSEIEDWLNKEGFNKDGCNGSVRDFYLDVSNGQLDITNEVFGWYRAQHPKAWYESEDRFENGNKYKGSEYLVKEIYEYFDSQVDFSRYDNDKDGTVESINILYAGSGVEWGQGLWPHAGWLQESRDNIWLNSHQMTNMSGTFSLYVFVHEMGHMIFGWPDLYWYGDYCTMGNRPNDQNPVAINDFYRADQGWIPFVDITSTDVSLEVAKPNEVCYRYKNPARPNDEGLVWSYVRNTGRNKVLKGSGLLMQHYDFSISGNSAANKLGLRIVRANHGEVSMNGDDDKWPSPGSQADAFFKSGTNSSFSDDLYPNIRWYNGGKTGLKITDIGTPGETLSFCIGENCPDEPASSSSAASSSSSVEITVQKIALETTLPISDSYAPATLDLKGSEVASILGIKRTEIEDKVEFYGVEPDGTLNSRTTGEGTGHWFDADGKIVAWDPNGTSIVFSNVDLVTMTTKIGHMPNKVKSGDSFTIRQALVYGSKQVTFEITVTISEKGTTKIISNLGNAKHGKPGSQIFNALGKPVGTRNAAGELPNLPKGIYVEVVK